MKPSRIGTARNGSSLKRCPGRLRARRQSPALPTTSTLVSSHRMAHQNSDWRAIAVVSRPKTASAMQTGGEPPDAECPGSKFGREKEAAIAALLTPRNFEEAAGAAGSGTQTLIRWLKIPEFQQPIGRRARQQCPNRTHGCNRLPAPPCRRYGRSGCTRRHRHWLACVRRIVYGSARSREWKTRTSKSESPLWSRPRDRDHEGHC